MVSGIVQVCARCGHARKVPVSASKKLSRVLRGKPPRATCGETTEPGWSCPCRSRYHVA